MAKRRNEAESVSGVATVRCNPSQTTQFTVIPDSGSSGTATVEVTTEDSDAYETLYDKYGDALSFSLDVGAKTYVLEPTDMKINRIRVTSDNSSDEFVLAWR